MVNQDAAARKMEQIELKCPNFDQSLTLSTLISKFCYHLLGSKTTACPDKIHNYLLFVIITTDCMDLFYQNYLLPGVGFRFLTDQCEGSNSSTTLALCSFFGCRGQREVILTSNHFISARGLLFSCHLRAFRQSYPKGQVKSSLILFMISRVTFLELDKRGLNWPEMEI